MTRRAEHMTWVDFVDRCKDRLVSDKLVADIAMNLSISDIETKILMDTVMGDDCIGYPGSYWKVSRALEKGTLYVQGWGHTLGLPPVEEQPRWDLLAANGGGS